MTDDCAILWRAVLAHALHDAAKGKDAGWIGTQDFRMVCALAGVEDEAVLTRFDPERFREAWKAMRLTAA